MAKGGRPNSGPSARNRNTLKNKASKTAQPFPLLPTEQQAFGAQLSAIKFQRGTQLASLREQAKIARAQAAAAASGIRADSLSGMRELSGAMAERGLLSSSQNMLGRQEVKSMRDSALQETKNALSQQLLAVDQQKLATKAESTQSIANLIAQRVAQQRLLSLRAYGSGGLDPYGLGPGAGPSSPKLKNAGSVDYTNVESPEVDLSNISGHPLLKATARAAKKSGSGWDFELLWRTENHDVGDNPHLHFAADRGIRKVMRLINRMPGFSTSRKRNDPGSHHHLGDAIDVNYSGGGKFKTEAEALDWLKAVLLKGLQAGGASQIDLEI